MKLSGYVAAYREDMAIVMALVKFLSYNMYVAYFFAHFYIVLFRFISRSLSLFTRIFETAATTLDFLDNFWYIILT